MDPTWNYLNEDDETRDPVFSFEKLVELNGEKVRVHVVWDRIFSMHCKFSTSICISSIWWIPHHSTWGQFVFPPFLDAKWTYGERYIMFWCPVSCSPPNDHHSHKSRYPEQPFEFWKLSGWEHKPWRKSKASCAPEPAHKTVHQRFLCHSSPCNFQEALCSFQQVLILALSFLALQESFWIICAWRWQNEVRGFTELLLATTATFVFMCVIPWTTCLLWKDHLTSTFLLS